MSDQQNGDKTNPVLVNTDGPAPKAPAADTFGKGARDGQQVVGERRHARRWRLA